MAQSKITFDKLSSVISDMLTEYGDSIKDKVEEVLTETANEATSELKATSPKKSGKGGGKYARSWANEITVSSVGTVKATVYNKKYYRLTHLLEYGHATRNGGRTRAIPHIEAVNDSVQQKAIEKIKGALS